MSSKESRDKNRTSHKIVTLWITATLVVLLGVLTGTSPAFASSAGAAQAGSPTAGIHIDTARASFVIPDIEAQSCDSSRANWVHIDFVAIGTICYGYKGTWKAFSEADLHSFCPGNNEGSFTYADATGKLHTFSFEGTGKTLTFMGLNDAVSLTITGWSGNHPC
jgi:hypothetical protein